MAPALFALLVCASSAGAADPVDEDDGARRARAYFLQAAAWVAAGHARSDTIRDVYADLRDVKIRDAAGRHEGHMRVWLQPPDRLRWEIKRTRTTPAVIKLLDGAKMWLYDGPAKSPTWKRMHGHTDGQAAVEQLQRDRDRFVNLARYLTFSGMQGPGVLFEDKGIHEHPAGHHLAGRWLKIRRVEPGGRSMAFLLAFSEDAAGTRRVTGPGAVLVPADAKAGTPMEHYVLKGWRSLHGRQVPRRVERWTARGGRPGLDRTMLAFVVDLKVDAGVRAERFRPPPAKPEPPGPSKRRK